MIDCRFVKNFLALLAAFVCAAIVQLAAAQPTSVGAKRTAPVAVGDIAPDFTLEDQDGRKHTLSAERGKRAVVLVLPWPTTLVVDKGGRIAWMYIGKHETERPPLADVRAALAAIK